MTMEAGDRSVERWFNAIAAGRLQLPRFQRFEAWGPSQVADLLKNSSAASTPARSSSGVARV